MLNNNSSTHFRLVCLIVGLCLSAHIFGQDAPRFADTTIRFQSDTIVVKKYHRIRSEGKDFWLTFLFQDLWFDEGRTTATLELLLSSRYNSQVQIFNPLTAWEMDTIVKQDSLLKIEVPIDEAMCKGYDSIEHKAIHIVADTFISVYASNFAPNTFDATNVMPSQTLGKEYIIQTYKGEYDAGGSPFHKNKYGSCISVEEAALGTFNITEVLPPAIDNMACQFYFYDTIKYQVPTTTYEEINGEMVEQIVYVPYDSICMVERVPSVFAIVGIEDNTQISITPSIDTYSGKFKSIIHHANVPYNITLNQGEVYQVIGSGTDPLSGSYIKANKNIAVYNGDICALVPDTIASCDHLVEQAMPVELWGDSFVVSVAQYQNFNQIVLTAKNNNTSIWVNDTLRTTINAFQSYEFSLSQADKALFVRATDSVACYLYLVGGSASGSGIVEDTTCLNKPDQPVPPLMQIRPTYPNQPPVPQRSDYATQEEYDDAYNYYYNNTYVQWQNDLADYYVADAQWTTEWNEWYTEHYEDWYYEYLYPWSKHYSRCNSDGTKNIEYGDPSMVWITPLNQRIPKITFATFDYYDKLSDTPYSCHFVNIVTTTASLDSMIMDGEVISAEFQPVKNHPELSYTIKNIKLGTHTIENNADNGGFVAHVYGIGNDESYAYNVGSLVTKIIEEKENTFAIIEWDIDTLCQTNSMIQIKYDAQSMIDSIEFHAALDHTIQSKIDLHSTSQSGSQTFIAHHVGIDTLFCTAYYHTFRSVGVGLQTQIDTIHTDTILFGAKFSATTLHQKWNDFIGVLTNNNDGMLNNGGYDFVGFQWYRNDSILEGETSDYLNQELILNAAYSAQLTTSDGLTSLTCPIIAEQKTDITEFPTMVSTEQLLRSPFRTETDMKIYGLTGQLVAAQTLHSNSTFPAPSIQGNYIVRFTTPDGYIKTYKLIVK